MIGTIAGIYNVGYMHMIGCIAVGVIRDRLSRGGTIFAGCLIVIAGSARKPLHLVFRSSLLDQLLL